MTPIAHIHTPFPSKFGLPRQSNVVQGLEGTIVFQPEYRVAEALRGIDQFDYLWVLWLFSANKHGEWSPTVRPPRLGGNARMGVFATRSPYRPNAIGLSSVRLLSVEWHSAQGPLLHVAGVDMMDGTPIVDIKPYLPYSDAHVDARSGFAPVASEHLLPVHVAPEVRNCFDDEQWQVLCDLLAQDPRPQYHADASRVYGMQFGRFDVQFAVGTDGVHVLAVK